MTVALHSDHADHVVDKSESDRLRGSLAVLAKLETSLAESQKALLALDLDAIEQGTRQQTALTGELATLVAREKLRCDGEAIIESCTQTFRVPAGGVRKDLRDAAMRIREAARLQGALLARAQRKLRTLANVLAGPEASYRSCLRMEGNVISRAIELSTADAHGRI
jgi:hypothetical protein